MEQTSPKFKPLPNIIVEMQVSLDGQSLGALTMELFTEAAPILVANFVKLMKSGTLDGTRFFKLKPNYYIQGGDTEFNAGVGGKSAFGSKIHEGLLDGTFTDKYCVGMVNKGPHSTGSQFFITLGPTPWLQGWMAQIGLVSQGFAVLERLQAVETDDQGTLLRKVRVDKATVIN